MFVLIIAFSDPTAFDLLEKFGSKCEVKHYCVAAESVASSVYLLAKQKLNLAVR